MDVVAQDGSAMVATRLHAAVKAAAQTLDVAAEYVADSAAVRLDAVHHPAAMAVVHLDVDLAAGLLAPVRHYRPAVVVVHHPAVQGAVRLVAAARTEAADCLVLALERPHVVARRLASVARVQA